MTSNPVGVFGSLVKWCKIDSISKDNAVFKLHYRATVLILLAFFITITTTQFVGEPIRCIGRDDKIKDAVNSFCWIFGTYTSMNHLTGEVGKHMAHAGVGPNVPGENELHHRYYQWVYFILPLQAIFFYAPHTIWKLLEAHKVKGLTEKLNCPLLPDEWKPEKKQNLVKYFLDSHVHMNNMYAYQFAFCELLNFVNSVGQIFILDLFLGGNFVQYGIMFWNYHRGNWETNKMTPMDIIFPKVTKCTFHLYGPSGGVQTFDQLCVLPLNIVHEKIFVFLWFWLIILSIISALALLYRMLVFMCPCIRSYSIMIQAKSVPQYYVYNIVNSLSISDWFMLNQVGKNMNTLAYKDLVTALGEELGKRKTSEFV